MSSPEIVVFGACGVVGRRVCEARSGARVEYAVAGRDREKLGALGVPSQVADASDHAALVRAFTGARVVIDAAGPLRETAAPVLDAAMTAGAHYVDVGGEQTALQTIYERHDSIVRRSGKVAVPGAGLDCTVGDLAAAWAAAHLTDHIDPGPMVRTTPADRVAEDRPLDEILVSYIYDDLALSAGSQRALFGTVGVRPLVWRRDRWEAGRTGDKKRVNAGPAFGGERDAIAHAAGDAFTIPRHVAATHVATYASTTRNAAASSALRLLAAALPLVPKTAASLLAPYARSDADYSRTRWGVVVQVRRGFSSAQIVVRGHDIYRATAACVAWIAMQLAARGAGPIGMRAPGELFRAEPALRELAAAADWIVEPSFGS
jgi:hypothetical protein